MKLVNYKRLCWYYVAGQCFGTNYSKAREHSLKTGAPIEHYWFSL